MLLPIVRVAPVQLKPFSLTENVAPLTFSFGTGLQPPTLLQEENLKQPLNVIIFTDITITCIITNYIKQAFYCETYGD